MIPIRLTLLTLVALIASACSFSLAEDIIPPPGSEQQAVSITQPVQVNGALYPLVPPSPESGRPIYAEKCAPCHGVTGQGDGPRAAQLPNPVAPLGSADFARQATPANWYTQVTQGNLERFMPPFNSLSDRQRWDVVAYSFSLSTPEETLEQGAELYQTNCAGCHGEQGRGDGPEAGTLAATLPDLTDQAFMAEKSAADFYQAVSEGISPNMPAFGDQLNEAERWTIADFVRTLTFASEQTGPIAAGETGSADAPPTTEIAAGASGAEAEATPIAAASVELGSVTGQVVNISGGEVPPDLDVILRAFDHMQPVYTQTVSIDSQGTFLFEAVDIRPELAYLATVEYEQLTYGSEIGVFEEGTTTLNLPVAIYESMTDASLLTVDRMHLFFDFLEDNTVRVVQLYIISNPTDRTLVASGAGQPTIEFSLPEGATNLEFQDGALGERFIETPGGFGDTISIRPGNGSYEMLYAYEMPYDRKLELVQAVPLPVKDVVILIPEDGVKLKGEGIQDDGTRDVQGVPYHLYSVGALQAGDELAMTLSGRPSGSSPSLVTGSNTGLVIGLGAFGLALIVAGVWLYQRTRGNGTEVERDEETASLPLEPAAQSVETLMDAIIALDDQYQAGQLPEDAYRQRRGELKARLEELMKDQDGN